MIAMILTHLSAIIIAAVTCLFLFHLSRQDSEKTNKDSLQEKTQCIISPAILVVSNSKYYSVQDKERLANALYKVSDILNKIGGELVILTNQIIRDWESTTARARIGYAFPRDKPNTALILSKLSVLKSLTTNFDLSLRGDNGVLKENAPYADELDAILQDAHLDKLKSLQTTVDKFEKDVVTLSMAYSEGNNASIRVHLIEATTPDKNSFQNAILDFNVWIDSCNERVENKRYLLNQG